MRIAFLGTPDAAVPTLDRLASDHSVVRVITRPDRRAPRGKRFRPSPVGASAESLGLSIEKPVNRAELRAIDFSDVDLAVVVAFGMLIPEDVLEQPKHGFINLHFSLLPRWRGAAPVERAILAGDDEHGISVMAMDAGLDTGDIYTMVVVPIEGFNAGEATERFADVGAGAVANVIEALSAGSAEPIPQQGESTYARKIEVSDARLSTDMSAGCFVRAVRAFNPRPGAFLMSEAGRFKVFAANESDHQVSLGAMEMVKSGVVLGLETGAVLLERVQAPGRKQMSASDWARGLKVPVSEMQWQ